MFKQVIGFVALLGASVGVPYTASEWRGIRDWLQGPPVATAGYSAEATELQRTWQRTDELLADRSRSSSGSGWFRTVSEPGNELEDTITDTVDQLRRDAESAVRNATDTTSQTARQAADSYRNNYESAANRNESNWSSGSGVPTRTVGDRRGSTMNSPANNENLAATQSANNAGKDNRAVADIGVVDLPEAINLELTEQYILQRWSRVNAGIVEGELRGYRVPLVTGATPDDPVGALTFYFNRGHRCERLTFSGTVGDPRRLIWFLVQRYGFELRPSPEPGMHLYQVRKGKNYSELQIRPAEIVRSSAPHLRYEFELVLYRL